MRHQFMVNISWNIMENIKELKRGWKGTHVKNISNMNICFAPRKLCKTWDCSKNSSAFDFDTLVTLSYYIRFQGVFFHNKQIALLVMGFKSGMGNFTVCCWYCEKININMQKLNLWFLNLIMVFAKYKKVSLCIHR